MDISVDEWDYGANVLVCVIFVVDFAEVKGEAYELLGFYWDLAWACSYFFEVFIDLDENLKFYLLSKDFDNLKEYIFSFGFYLPLLFDFLHELNSDLFVHRLE